MARIPQLQQLSTNILFDKSSWESISSILPENKQVMSAAADRWHTYIKLNPALIEKMRAKLPKWNGITISRLTPEFGLGEFAAKCGSHNVIIYTDQGVTFKCPTKFWLLINLNNYNSLTSQKKLDLLTHEFGHALGFSSQILKPTIGGYTNSTNLPGAVNAYNDIMINNNFYAEFFANNSIIPIENKGPPATKGQHWEDNLRSINNQPYAGVETEIMIGHMIPSQAIISKMTIKALVDGRGYIEKNPGASEGNPTLDN